MQVIRFLEEMIGWTDIETSTKSHMSLSLRQCEFNVGLILLKHIF